MYCDIHKQKCIHANGLCWQRVLIDLSNWNRLEWMYAFRVGGLGYFIP